MKNGNFVISLDFELLWGVRDKKTIEQYGENIKNVHQVIPELLKVFNSYQVKATFATVGFLFFNSKSELLDNLPAKSPNYTNKKLSPYIGSFQSLGENIHKDPYHFGGHLIRLIQQYPEQEIGSHTFSHYYCLEEGQTKEDFKADIQNAQKVAAEYELSLTSLVFPRNQFNDEYLEVCKELGIICIRGNESSWLYEARNEENESLIRRALRLMDAYVNLSGHNCYTEEFLRSKDIVNIPASRFLRPYSEKLKILEGLRLKRIKSGMSYAAKNKQTFHLWWHPHNFGLNQKENFAFLIKVLDHYRELSRQFNFQSCTMSALAKTLKNEENLTIRR